MIKPYCFLALLLLIGCNPTAPIASDEDVIVVGGSTGGDSIIILPSIVTPKIPTLEELPILRIISWNLQAFGPSKANNPEFMQVVDNVIGGYYDIVFFQEIRDSTGEAWKKLCSDFSKEYGYSCYISHRVGSTQMKEQYGVLYLSEKVYPFLVSDENAPYVSFERPPLIIDWQIRNADYKFTTVTVHIDPDKVREELESLEVTILRSGNVIIMGDLNADCDYYDETRKNAFTSNWAWVVPDYADTTVSNNTSCAYDRIILNADAMREYGGSGLLNPEMITKEVSDHYPVTLVIVAEEQNAKPVVVRESAISLSTLRCYKLISSSL